MIATARDLLVARTRRPRQSNLRRAVSSAYYAMFHCLARCCADLLVGGASAHRSPEAWRQVYRSLEHQRAKKNCMAIGSLALRFPKEIEDFAGTFANLQVKRHAADYDPKASFFKSSVLQDIADAEAVMAKFVGARLADRRAFAAYVLFERRT